MCHLHSTGLGPGLGASGHSFSQETTGLLSHPHVGLWWQVVKGMSVMNGGVHLFHSIIHSFPLGQALFKEFRSSRTSNSKAAGPSRRGLKQGCVQSTVCPRTEWEWLRLSGKV